MSCYADSVPQSLHDAVATGEGGVAWLRSWRLSIMQAESFPVIRGAVLAPHKAACSSTSNFTPSRATGNGQQANCEKANAMLMRMLNSCTA